MAVIKNPDGSREIDGNRYSPAAVYTSYVFWGLVGIGLAWAAWDWLF